MKLHKKNSILLTLGLIVGVAFNASASEEVKLPCSTAKLIVPWGAGGDTDIIFRTIVDQVNKDGLKPQLQVINVPGRSGNKGSASFLRARKNGCQILAIHQSLITSYLAGQAKVNWDGYQPVALLTETAQFIGANGKQPYNTLAELQTYAKQNPDKVVAVGSLGSTSHYAMLMLEDSLGVKFRHVSYDGTRERVTALLSGNAHIGLTDLSVAEQNIDTGAIKMLASTGSERELLAPDIPTVKEQGFDVEFAVRRGIALPKGTDPKIVKHYQDAFKKVMQDPELKEALQKKGTVVKYLDSDDYSALLKKEYLTWEALAKKVGIYNVK